VATRLASSFAIGLLLWTYPVAAFAHAVSFDSTTLLFVGPWVGYALGASMMFFFAAFIGWPRRDVTWRWSVRALVHGLATPVLMLLLLGVLFLGLPIQVSALILFTVPMALPAWLFLRVARRDVPPAPQAPAP
jgi:hypothetical protein